MGLQLTISEFADGDPIPSRHTCQGDDVSVSLEWSGEPPNTKSFALIMDDPDAPGGTWNHWLLWNIPQTKRSIAGEFQPGDIGQSGTNDFGKQGYGGPCPPRAHGPHRYYFRLFALDVEKLDVNPGAKRADLDRVLRPHVLTEAQYMGTYERK